jgi:hypothetical protein
MRRKRLLLTSLILLLSCVTAEATTRTVKQAGGDFTTIQACATAIAAGDTCLVFVGTYNEVVSIPAGTAGKYKILQANAGDTVNVFGFTMGSHTKVIGFNITRPASPASNSCISVPAGTTDAFITNNTMTSCGSGSAMISEAETSTGSSFIYIQGNTMSYGCDTPAAPNTCKGMHIVGDHQLIENNVISHVSDGATLYANHTVFRGNKFLDQLESECGSHSSNCHRDAIESEPVVGSTPASAFNLYEGNTILRNIGNNAHVFLTQGDACSGQCSNTIMRFNVSSHIGTDMNGTQGTGLLDDNGGYAYVKTYNNTVACNGWDGSNTDSFASNSSHGSVINTIYYYCHSMSGQDPYAAWGGAQTGFVAKNNLGYCTSVLCNLLTSGGTFLTDLGNLVKVNPLFVNVASDDYHLQVGSPAIGAGSYLTTTSGSASGSTSLTVADASFFQDGMGITGVQPDGIRIGASTTVQISSINYATNVITLASPVSWSSGAGVYLYKDSRGNVVLSGANPDVGAYPSGVQAPPPIAPPTNLQGVVIVN